MTAYNREMFIAEAIESVLKQIYTNFELIIVDDCSSDSSVKIISSYAEVDKRIKLYINESNLGDYPNRNKAASFANGEFLVFVDSDDTIENNTIEYLLNSFKNFPEAVHSSIYFGGDFKGPRLIDSSTAIRDHFFKNNTLACGPGARCFRKSFYDKLGGYPEKYGPANDMYFNIYTTSIAPILMLPYNYLNYRRHEGQEQNNEYAYLYNRYNYLNDLLVLPYLPISNSEKYKLYLGNKRRFIVNSIHLLFQKKSLNLFFAAIKKTKFGLKDCFFSFGFSSHIFKN
jgi:glycosyltransferase involved in cell wall biosynthesis